MLLEMASTVYEREHFVSLSSLDPIQTEGGGGGKGTFDATQELNPYYSRTIASIVFLLREFFLIFTWEQFGVVRFW